MNCLVVAAAIVQRGDTFLLTRRPAGAHLEGLWEFPGGKCEAGETLAACLARELREELAVDAAIGGECFTVTHDYGDRQIELHFFSCVLEGAPAPQLGQEMRWVSRADLRRIEFPPADAALIARLTGDERQSDDAPGGAVDGDGSAHPGEVARDITERDRAAHRR